MITSEMNYKEVQMEIFKDWVVLSRRLGGWHKKYHKQLSKKQSKNLTFLEHKVYDLPSNNRVHAIFCVERSTSTKHQCLIWWFVWEVPVPQGGCRYYIQTSNLVSHMVVSAHAAQRVKERSGKSFIDMYIQTILSSTRGVFMWTPYLQNNRDNEVIADFGDGCFIGVLGENGERIATTYVDKDRMYSNQLETTFGCRTFAQDYAEESHKVWTSNPKKEYGFVRAKA